MPIIKAYEDGISKLIDAQATTGWSKALDRNQDYREAGLETQAYHFSHRKELTYSNR